jgi:hypothetical protein
MSETFHLPPSQEIRARMAAIRDELGALKKLLRAAVAAAEARRRRQEPKRSQ